MSALDRRAVSIGSFALTAGLIATGCGPTKGDPGARHAASPMPKRDAAEPVAVLSRVQSEFDGAVLLSSSTGSTIAKLPGVSSATSDGKDGWFVERHVGGRAAGAGCIAHVLSDGSVDSAWHTSVPMHGCEGDVLRRVDRRLYVGGRVPTGRNHRRRPLLALNASTGALLRWQPALPPRARVRDVAASRGTVYVRYQVGSGYPAHVRVVALDAKTGARLNWSPSRAALYDRKDPRATAGALAVRGGVVYIAVGSRVIAVDARTAARIWRSRQVPEGRLEMLTVGPRAVYASGWHSSFTRIDRASGRFLPIGVRGVAAAAGIAGSKIYAISSIEWGWHDWEPAGTTSAAIAIDDRTGRLTSWRPPLAPWAQTHAVVPNRSGMLVVGFFSQTPGG